MLQLSGLEDRKILEKTLLDDYSQSSTLLSKEILKKLA